jgi:uncharacterized membrane protein YraQ (UPF0718 family)
MSNTDEKFITYWKKYSLMGKLKYSLFAVLFGILSAIIMELAFSYLWQSNDSITLKSLSQRILILSILAFFYGRFQWNVNEKRFQELSKPKPGLDKESITSSEDPVSQ